MKMKLGDPTRVMLDEIANKATTRKDVAQTFALVIKFGQLDEVRWGEVGEAAIARWSASGWKWIKEQAWSGKCFPRPAALNAEPKP